MSCRSLCIFERKCRELNPKKIFCSQFMAVLLFSLLFEKKCRDLNPKKYFVQVARFAYKSLSYKVCLIKDATSEPEVLRFVIDRDLSSSLSYLVCLYMKRTVFATNASSKDKCAGDFTRLLNINRGI